MSTGSQGASESARASSGASSERRSRTARRARFRSPIRVAAEPDVHHRRTAYPADDDLVFGHPQLGTPLERSRLLKRYKRRGESGRHPRHSFPRPPSHIRHAYGRRRRPNADAPGVDGPSRLQDDADLRRLRPDRPFGAEGKAAGFPCAPAPPRSPNYRPNLRSQAAPAAASRHLTEDRARKPGARGGWHSSRDHGLIPAGHTRSSRSPTV